MIQSMTGFGKAVTETDKVVISTEIRSVNSKGFDLILRIPSTFREKETGLRTALSKSLERGKVDLFVNVESAGAETSATLNKELALAYYRQLKELAASINEERSDYLSIILRMPEILKSQREEISDNLWDPVQQTIFKAMNELIRFRQDEGETLAKDISMRINNISNLLDKVMAFDPQRIISIRERISSNIEEAVGREKIDTDRFEQEMIYYLEKLDITEEKVRLRSHCDYFLKTMDEPDPQGKKLGFISQEIGREINTLGSKANHAEIQKLVVQMKDELEKIKEQVLNVL